MTLCPEFSLKELDIEALTSVEGHLAILLDQEGRLGKIDRRINKVTRGLLARLCESKEFSQKKSGDVISFPVPMGLGATMLHVVIADRKASAADMRKFGVSLAKARGTHDITVALGSPKHSDELVKGLLLRSYDYNGHRSGEDKTVGSVTLFHARPETVSDEIETAKAIADGVYFTRDLTNDPANVLTTTEFANRLHAMQELGLEVEVLEEDKLAELGMGALLCVGQGSDSPSKVVVMKWNGGGDEAPFALVGKGVVFDTGGISLKPAAGMEDMTMDMGGAGVVSGVMMTLAKRKAKANVVGLVGLVENMPSGNATRPGDIVTSMKGDTIEVLNTDAEGRLVLCDVLWYAQQRFQPTAMINLATLTGAIIIGLGHENAGVFSNDDTLCNDLLSAAKSQNEGAWRMPLSDAYDQMLKSRKADMKNIGGRDAGSITAAQFLKRFVNDDTPWAHIDIAGVAQVKKDTAHAPAGATGWGVMTLDKLIADKFEA